VERLLLPWDHRQFSDEVWPLAEGHTNYALTLA